MRLSLIHIYGPVACGKDIDEAILVTKAMEKACDIYLSIMTRARIEEIPACYAESERYRFLHTLSLIHIYRQIYVKRPDIGAVVHAHTKKCMACLLYTSLLYGEVDVGKRYVAKVLHGNIFKL